jgi:hypothetical protein
MKLKRKIPKTILYKMIFMKRKMMILYIKNANFILDCFKIYNLQ